VRLLVDVLGPTDGVAAWQQTRSYLETCQLGDPIYILFDLELKQAVVIHKLGSVGEAIEHGRPVRLVYLTERRREIDAAFNRLCAAVERPASAA
jgi:hypothetical protein